MPPTLLPSPGAWTALGRLENPSNHGNPLPETYQLQTQDLGQQWGLDQRPGIQSHYDYRIPDLPHPHTLPPAWQGLSMSKCASIETLDVDQGKRMCQYDWCKLIFIFHVMTLSERGHRARGH